MGSASVFSAEKPDEEIGERLAALDLHPAISLWSADSYESSDTYTTVAARNPALVDGLSEIGLDTAYRPLRLSVNGLRREDDQQLVLEFSLFRGGYATSVLREILSALNE